MTSKKMNMAAMALSALLCLAITGARAETVTWSSLPSDMSDTVTSGGVTMKCTRRITNNIYDGTTTFTNSLGGNFTKIEIVCEENRPSDISGWSLEAVDGYWFEEEFWDPMDGESYSYSVWKENYKLTWTGEAESVSFTAHHVYNIKSMTFTIATANTPVTGVTLSQTEAALTAGDAALELTPTVAPEGATDKTVKWSVTQTGGFVALYTDEACTQAVGTDAIASATVYVKPLAAGQATITVTSNADATKTATCAMTVAEPLTGYAAWAEDNGITGAWNETSGGIYNVFRYVFGQPTGVFPLITGIDVDVGESEVVITTSAVVNSDGVTVSVVESSDVAGKTVTATKAVDAAGSTEFTKSAESPRFYRLKAEVTE